MVDTNSEKKAGLLARKAKREEKWTADIADLELEALELEDKYETDGLRCGIDFAVDTTSVSNFVVKKPDFLVAKKFADSESKGVEEVMQFVAPCLMFPEQMTARALFQEHGGIVWRLAALLMKLYEADAGQKQKKS